MHPALIVGMVAFGCIFGSALLGMLSNRLLPWSEPSKEITRLATSIVATLAAVAVGLLLTSAQSSFAAKDGELKRLATEVILLDRRLAEYGPETREARALLRETVARSIEVIWGEPERPAFNPDAITTLSGAPIQHVLLELDPDDEKRRWLKTFALEANSDIERMRWLIVQQKDGSIHWPFLTILVLWFALIFLSYGACAPRNRIALAVLSACALSVASALYLVVQLDQPYQGPIRITSTPLQLALEQIGE